ncbi:hypothetical protein J1605_007556 [Eschrichtius robustus]|uniref:Uncharacterized protein n=1 Tax=Eschrichtius robustus TaxID=9764 RepID=A0AB34H275_ESCRO|nr:hypothetical protein J1605_007556 [Eschrichtius robustus]
MSSHPPNGRRAPIPTPPPHSTQPRPSSSLGGTSRAAPPTIGQTRHSAISAYGAVRAFIGWRRWGARRAGRPPPPARDAAEESVGSSRRRRLCPLRVALWKLPCSGWKSRSLQSEAIFGGRRRSRRERKLTPHRRNSCAFRPGWAIAVGRGEAAFFPARDISLMFLPLFLF